MSSVMSRCFSLLSYILMIQVSLAGFGFGFAAASAEKVSLDVYYESLCPYCANFIVNLLPAIFENGLIEIIDLNFYPWGNARILSGNSIACQHGPSECLLNEIDACALDVWPTLGEHFPFIYCVEDLVYEGTYTQWETCFKKLGLDAKPVTDCYSSGYGKQLVLKYGAVTDALEPRKAYVPWVVVDGQPLYEDYDEFMSYVCKAYKGSPPSACSELSMSNSLLEKSDDTHAHPVCYTQKSVKELIQSLTGPWLFHHFIS